MKGTDFVFNNMRGRGKADSRAAGVRFRSGLFDNEQD
jgi:hypothetical protein